MKDENDNIVPFEKKGYEKDEGDRTSTNHFTQKSETILLEFQEERQALTSVLNHQNQFLQELATGTEKFNIVTVKFMNAFEMLQGLDAQLTQSVNAAHEHFAKNMSQKLQGDLTHTMLPALEKEIDAATSLFRRLHKEHWRRTFLMLSTFLLGSAVMGFTFYYYVERKMEPFYVPYYQKRYFLGDIILKNWDNLTEKEKTILMKKLDK